MPAHIVCFGEILWDLLPTGEQPGGAPMNVAYHLQKLGVPVSLISRLGNDAYGDRLLEYVSGHQLDTGFIQRDPEQPTGIVHAHPNEQHEVSYEIVQPVAWDFIAWEDRFEQLLQQAEYFVYGSLSARSGLSRKTLLRLLEAAGKRVFDINIRPPHFDKALAQQLLRRVDVLKLNEHELPELASWIQPGGTFEAQAARVQDHFEVPVLVVTRGGAGAVLRTDNRLYSHPGFKVQVADTVGSGDAFLAGLLRQLQQGTPPGEALAFACATGALVASYSGACPEYDPAAINGMLTRG